MISQLGLFNHFTIFINHCLTMIYKENFQLDKVAYIASPKGAKMDYVQKLQVKMKEQEFDEGYIKLCSDYAQRLIDNDVPVVFDYRHLSLLLGLEPSEIAFYLFADESLFYKEIKIPKKRSGFRKIDIPSERLKRIQRWILDNVLYNMKIHECCYGFSKGKSIYDNALLHVNKECVLNLDLKDFFPSIKQENVFNIFYGKGYTKKVSYYFAKLLTKNGVLPQGSPASPMISNIVAEHLDKRLSALAKKYHADYSRYADDITFSGASNVKNIIPIVTKIIREEGFDVNVKKTRYAYYYQRQEVTGLIVNKKVSVSKEYIKELNKEIYFCKKFGVVSHLEKTNNHKSFYKEHLYGKAYFVNMIDKDMGQKILEQLDTIMWEY